MNRTEHLLTILAEECAEVAQRASKALRFGLQEIQPGQGLTNAQRIGHELNDLWAVVELLGDASILALASDTAAIERKKEKVRHYMDYAKECGSLDSRQPIIPGDGWQPIETAPKSTADGRDVHGIYLLGFCPEHDLWDLDSAISIVWWEPLMNGGRGMWYGEGGHETHPTHWMPLPPLTDEMAATQEATQ